MKEHGKTSSKITPEGTSAFEFFDEAAEWTLDKFHEMGWDGVAIRADLAEIDQCKEIVKKANEAFGQVDIFVSNAVAGQRDFIVDTPDDVWEKVR